MNAPTERVKVALVGVPRASERDAESSGGPIDGPASSVGPPGSPGAFGSAGSFAEAPTT